MFKFSRKKLASILLISSIIFIPSISCAHALDIHQQNIGVSIICPEQDIDLYGQNKPTNIWDINTKGRYNFSGSANVKTLYSNYKFKGKTNYTIYVENRGEKTLEVRAKSFFKTYATEDIKPGSPATITISNIGKDTEFYLTFYRGDFVGYIN